MKNKWNFCGKVFPTTINDRSGSKVGQSNCLGWVTIKSQPTPNTTITSERPGLYLLSFPLTKKDRLFNQSPDSVSVDKTRCTVGSELWGEVVSYSASDSSFPFHMVTQVFPLHFWLTIKDLVICGNLYLTLISQQLLWSHSFELVADVTWHFHHLV